MLHLKEEKFITEFLKEVKFHTVSYSAVDSRCNSPSESRSINVIKSNKRLLKVISNIDKTAVVEYLRRIAHNIT